MPLCTTSVCMCVCACCVCVLCAHYPTSSSSSASSIILVLHHLSRRSAAALQLLHLVDELARRCSLPLPYSLSPSLSLSHSRCHVMRDLCGMHCSFSWLFCWSMATATATDKPRPRPSSALPVCCNYAFILRIRGQVLSLIVLALRYSLTLRHKLLRINELWFWPEILAFPFGLCLLHSPSLHPFDSHVFSLMIVANSCANAKFVGVRSSTWDDWRALVT